MLSSFDISALISPLWSQVAVILPVIISVFALLFGLRYAIGFLKTSPSPERRMKFTSFNDDVMEKKLRSFNRLVKKFDQVNEGFKKEVKKFDSTYSKIQKLR